MINSTDVWGTKNPDISGNRVAYLSAKDFGKYGSTQTSPAANSQIVVKLFETTNRGSSDEQNIDDATAQYWQVVYRSMGASSDVLTLYMCSPYTSAMFNPYYDTNGEPLGTELVDGEYGYNGNYSHSYLRDKTVLKLYDTLAGEMGVNGVRNGGIFNNLDSYVVTPSEIPGEWQSSEYQTSYNLNRAAYSNSNSSSGVGASGYMNTFYSYGLNNGLDTEGVPHADWTNTNIESAYTDKLWVPSAFEVLHTAYGQASNSTVGDTGRAFDENDVAVYLSDSTSVNAGVSSEVSAANRGDDRTGLWELNGYDRAGNLSVWLRSGYSSQQECARVVNTDGGGGNVSGVNNAEVGVRVALHLDLKKLAEDYLTLVTASQKAVDGTESSIETITSTVTSGLQTTLSSHNYYDYTASNSSSDRYKKVITFSTGSTENQIKSFTLQSGDVKKTVFLTNPSGSGTSTAADGLCDYMYAYEGQQLKVTVSNLQTRTLNVQANVGSLVTVTLNVTNSVQNSVLMLTLLIGSDKVGEFGFAYSTATQTVSMSLPQDATIKILATKPFGSRTEFELDGTELTSVDGVSYQLQTNYTSSKTLVVTLDSSRSSGGFSGNNFIIV